MRPDSPLPDGWRQVRLEDVAIINPKRPALHVEDDALVTFVPMAAVGEGCAGILAQEERAYHEVSRGYTYFEEADVLFAKITPCVQNGKHALASDLRNGIGFGTTEFHVIRGGPDIEPRHLFRVLTQPENIEKCVRSFSGTAGQQRVQPDILRSLRLCLPPLHEQRAIAAILDSIDEAIERTEEVIVATVRLRDALLHDLLTRGLPGRHTEFKQVRGLGTIPATWDVVRLEDICEVVGGSTPSRARPEYWGGDVPWVTPSEITELGGRELTAARESITSNGMQSTGLRLIPAGSVLLTTRATIGATAMNTIPVTTNQGFQNLIPGSQTDATWLYYLATAMKGEPDKRAAGSTFREVSRDGVRSMRIGVPPLEEQKTIGSNIESIYQTLMRNVEHRDTLEALRSSAADALLTGRVRKAKTLSESHVET